MYKELIEKKTKIAVIGLGYVGLPIALEFAKKVTTIGFDIKEKSIGLLKQGIDPNNELDAEAFENTDILYTSDPNDIKDASVYIVAVPTPVNDHNLPNITPLLKATETVGKVLDKGNYVIYESTVYPGCTEDDCVPVLEDMSGLKFVEDFKVGYSPERINPGDKKHTLKTIVKVTSGCDKESSAEIAELYKLVVDAGIHEASSIKVAEAAKIIENTQRDINIAFMNELSIIFNRLNINTFEVLEAAGTKWNFLNFFPGLVGGHCIGVDPYYLTYKAEQLGYHAQIINAGRFINDSMGAYIAKQTVKKIIAQNKNINLAKVLVMGATFKENVSDIRNSKIVDAIKEFESFGVKVDVIDPKACSNEMKEEYDIEIKPEPGCDYDAIILAVNHKEYVGLDEDYFVDLCAQNALFVDIKGIYKGIISKLEYWSL
jgi:UDP-N-acetyl-D-galactosamine dehydrogenase